MRSYKTARNLFGTLGVFSQVVIGIGGLAAIAGGTASGSSFLLFMLGALPGIGIALLGTYGLAMVQMGRSGVDSAEYAQQALDVARRQLEVSQQVLEQGRRIEVSYASLAQAKSQKPTDETVAPEETSYGNRDTSDANSTGIEVDNAISGTVRPEPLEIDAAKNADVLEIEHQPAIPLPEIDSEIRMEVDGRYRVNGKPFWSKDEAEAYARELEAAD